MLRRNLEDVRKDVEALQKELGIKVRFKDEWWLMKLIGALLFFNKGFMDRYTTTIGNTVAFPDRDFIKNDSRFIRVMLHEMIHVQDQKRFSGAIFALLYLAPQIFALGALGALGAFWDLDFLWCLTCLIFLAPWPSPGRVWAELRGYAITMAFHHWWRGAPLLADPVWINKSFPHIVENFVGWGYYRMWWSRAGILKRLGRYVKLLKSENELGKEIPLAPQIKLLFKSEEASR